jgi:hypothetical protein
MYPTGMWRGYWEDTVHGRQPMADLSLRFDSGRIDGDGVDVVGRFTFTGTYDGSGAVTLVKHYVDRHQVLYQGAYDGEGSILGRWSIEPSWSGPFALAPVLDEPRADAVVAAAGTAA